MKIKDVRRQLRERRKRRVHKQLSRCELPLLTFFRSSKHIYAQLVDPVSGKTVTTVSTLQAGLAEGLQSRKDKEAAKRVGTEIAKRAIERDIRQVAFNRNGFVYTGRVKALADAAREAGLQF